MTGRRRDDMSNLNAPQPVLHVEPWQDEGWALKREGDPQPLSVHATQKEAVVAGRDAARREDLELLVHTDDGLISGAQAYGEDATG
jgi:hypothetical protein